MTKLTISCVSKTYADATEVLRAIRAIRNCAKRVVRSAAPSETVKSMLARTGSPSSITLGRLRLMAVRLAAIVLLPTASATAQPVDWSHAQLINVEMLDNKFIPDHLMFQHGMPYRLHLENRGKNLHEFTAPEFLATATVRDPGALANGGKDIVVQAGATADIYLEPRKAGTYPLACADHDWDGMVGEIVVK